MASPESLEQDVGVKAEEVNHSTPAPIFEQQQQQQQQQQHLSLDEIPSVAESASPDSPNRIYNDLREYELDDQEYLIEEGSGSGSDKSGSSDLSEEEDFEEFPFREERGPPSLSGIWVTTTVTVESTPIDQLTPPPPRKMPNPSVPKPGPAKLPPKAGLPEWLSEAKQCHYLPENVMKQLCEMVKECLMEGEFYILTNEFGLLLTSPHRVQYPTRLHTGHNLR
jgi:hypothetical protein